MKLVILSLGLVVLAACGGRTSEAPSSSSGAPSSASAQPAASAGAAASAKPAARFQLKSSYTTTGASQAALWAAKEGGYFDEEGLDVTELQLITNLGTIFGALQSGEIPITFVSAPPTLTADLQGGEFTIVAGFTDRILGELWTHPSITTPEQLKGKALGVTGLGSAGQNTAEAALDKLGLKGQVGFVATGAPPTTLAAIQNGTVQGATFTPPEDLAARAAGLRMLLDIATLNIPSQQSTVTSTRTFIKQRPDVVEHYVRAVLKGIHRLRTDRPFAVQVLGKYSKIEDQAILNSALDYYSTRWTKDGLPSLPGIQQNLDSLVSSVPAAKDAKPEQFVDTTFVDKIKAAGSLDP